MKKSVFTASELSATKLLVFKKFSKEQIIPNIQNVGVLHSNDIQNRRIEFEERVAVQNKKIVIDSKVKELEGE